MSEFKVGGLYAAQIRCIANKDVHSELGGMTLLT